MMISGRSIASKEATWQINIAAAPKRARRSAKPTEEGSLLSRDYSFGGVGNHLCCAELLIPALTGIATGFIGVITALWCHPRSRKIFVDRR